MDLTWIRLHDTWAYAESNADLKDLDVDNLVTDHIQVQYSSQDSFIINSIIITLSILDH